VAEVAGARTAAAPGLTAIRRRVPSLRRIAGSVRRNEHHFWSWGGRLAAVVPLAALVAAVVVLADKAWPAVQVNGAHFLVGSAWKLGNTYGAIQKTDGVSHPLGSDYGAWPLIAGTLQSSAIALVIALPISLGAAFALTERIPRWLAEILRFGIEILAGVPSVVIGLWGALTLGPLLARDVYPPIANNMPDVPVLSYFRNPVGHGEGLLTSGIILALMIVPIIASTARNLLAQVPALPKEGGEALGLTDWEVTRKITLPWVRSGLIGATVLGLGRALGETIAIAMVSGALLNTISPNIYGTMGTIAAAIVTQLDSAFTDGTGFAVATLAELALVLAVVSLIVNMIARYIVHRTGNLSAPVGAGF
jgi:phosphate transport system permease protein